MEIRLPTLLRTGTIIQAKLNTDINSDTNRRGDKITADVTDDSAGLPSGTRLEGYVQGVRERTTNHPGWLSLSFTTLIMPNGKTYPVQGTFEGIGRVGSAWVHNAHFRMGTTFGVRLTSPIRFRS